MTTAFEPRHPAYAERVRDSIASQPLMSRLFPVVIERVEPGLVELSLAVAPDFLQPHGNVHGVLAAALADSAAGYAAQTLLALDRDVVTVEYKINYLAPGFGDRLLACAETVFGERGAGASLDDIAAEAGVTKSLVFRYWESKDSLLEEVLLRAGERYRGWMQHDIEFDPLREHPRFKAIMAVTR